ncbi:MAG: sigma-70 family RNA polymerase sigma factor [Verrucomicrobia bacterium]|nr:sigma-70 family RNA polymerase sigma factor [Verrucomicrobiota bacterium]
MNPDEQALLSQLTKCYDEHKESLLRNAGAFASPFYTGEDILQDALRTAVRRLHDFPAKKCTWLTWLNGLIRTARMDSIRTQRRKQKRVVLANDLGAPGDEVSEELAEVTAGEWDLPDDLVSHMEDAEFLKKAMEQLRLENPLWHTVLSALYANDEPSNTELSSRLALTAENIRKIHSRAIKRLRDIANELRNR